jgi:hypothetical protein
MVDEVKAPGATETETSAVPAEDFNAGFLAGLETTEPDPLDFADKPVVAKDEPAVEPVVETPAPVVAVETPAPVTPTPVDTAQIIDMLDKRLPPKVEPAALQPAAPVVAEAPKAPEPAKPVLSDAETERLEELAKGWPDVQEMLQLNSRVVADTVAREVAKAVAGVQAEFNAFKQSMKPVQDSVQLSAEERFDSTVKAAHPEMYDPKGSDAFADELVDWVKKQPAWMREAAANALQSANPQDSIDLITQFKKDTGKVTEVTEKQTPPPAVTDKTNKEKRLEQMTKPTSRQTKGAESDDPLDYEGGFKEMAREIARTA